MFDLDLLSERARVTPDRVALVSVETGERHTYARLNARAERAAERLRAVGLREGDRFGLWSHNSIEFIALFFGAGKAGAIVVPLSTRATAHEAAQIAADCGMSALFYGEEFSALAAQIGVPTHAIAEELRGTPRNSEEPRHYNPESTYCLLYTSGTTGKPKGVMIPRRQLYWNGYNTAVNWGLREDDVSPIFTPLYHAGGLAAFLIPIFCVGGTMILHRAFEAAEVWRTIEREHCTVVLGVPTIWKLLMDAPEFATADLSSVRWLISGGAPLPQYLIAAYQQRGVVFKQGYGMTEVGVNCFTMTVEESFRKPGSIGRPMLFTEVRLVDADGRDVPEGEIGEMWIRGPHVSNGYWNNEEATRATYDPEGWLRTGDLARRDDEGFFTIAGRRKEMFISGGVNVYPAEIEAELVSHPGVSDAAVVAVPDATWGEVAVAFVVGSASADELASYLTMRIAKYKVPRRFVFMDALPRTPYGKVQKTILIEAEGRREQ
jgi:fatty-acyl-CoA synthase